jgi:cell division protease FtsH
VIIDLIVEKLMDIETMDGEEFRELLSKYTILPSKNLPYVSKFN